ncbi:hypothetical protein G6F40_015801 [Rhizopus arrhizus]|nr:hypothetical protein G6F40_015801 [Rhizopus arrhizus]
MARRQLRAGIEDGQDRRDVHRTRRREWKLASFLWLEWCGQRWRTRAGRRQLVHLQERIEFHFRQCGRRIHRHAQRRRLCLDQRQLRSGKQIEQGRRQDDRPAQGARG